METSLMNFLFMDEHMSQVGALLPSMESITDLNGSTSSLG